MNKVFNAPTVTINHMRVKSAGLDPHAEQWRLARLLNTVDLNPPSLPPAAILCIRRLRDPLPGALNLQRSDLLRPNPVWSQALTTTLDQLARQAVRPAVAAVPANAPAVLFQDRAELLACLARDWLAGTLLTQWWWRSLLEPRRLLGQALQTTVLTTWGEAAAFVPAACHHLAHQGYLVRFASRLAATEARSLLQAMTHQFGLAALQQLLTQARDDIRPTSVNRNSATAVAGTGSSGQRATPSSPWQRWAPELAETDLSPDQQVLLGVALGLQRNPAAVRSSAFAQAVQTWPRWHSRAGRWVGEPERVDDDAADPILPTDSMSAEASEAQTRLVVDHTPGEPGNLPALAATEPLPVTSEMVPEISVGQWEQTTGAKVSVPFVARTRVQPFEDAIATVVSALPTEQAEAPPAWYEPGAVETIGTNYGGLFYLINLGIYLGFYADFTTPLAVENDLNIYDFMALVGEALVGEALHHDPVWALLARLAGRNEAEPPNQNRSDLHLSQWLAQQMVTIQQRLAAALGEDDPVQVAQLVCVHSARVRISATHLDLYFSLEQHPIQIRLSGLDRNPGWVPAAGRFLAFHFE